MMGIPEIEPYTMCSREECEERVKNNEVSIFEMSWITSSSSSENGDSTACRILDPCKAVTKYRRRTAAFHESFGSPRTLGQLQITVHYLSQLLIHFDSVTDSFLNLVNFVEDRLRAVQVDLTVAQHASKPIQYAIVHIQILILYILADCQQYQHTFGRKALHAALSNYWNDHAGIHPSSPTCEKEDMITRDDEIISLSILILLNDQIVHCQKHSSEITMDQLIFGTTDLYRKHSQSERRTRSLPKFLHWTMRLISNVLLGHWRMALQMIMSNLEHPDNGDENSSIFLTMVRLCMAPSIRYIQWKALQLYNIALMPRERMSGLELARLLYFSSPKESLQFAQQYGLPVEDGNSGDDDDDDCVVTLKVEPIQSFGKNTKPSSESNHSVRANMDRHVLKNDHFRISDGMNIPSVDWMSHLLNSSKDLNNS